MVFVTVRMNEEVLSISLSEHEPQTEETKFVEVPIEDLVGASYGDICSVIGQAIVGILQSFGHMSEFPAEDSEQNEATIERGFALIRERAENGDPSSQYALAAKLISDSLKNADARLLFQAEQLLTSSAAGGHSKSREFLETSWGKIKKAHTQEILRRQKDNDSGGENVL